MKHRSLSMDNTQLPVRKGQMQYFPLGMQGADSFIAHSSTPSEFQGSQQRTTVPKFSKNEISTRSMLSATCAPLLALNQASDVSCKLSRIVNLHRASLSMALAVPPPRLLPKLLLLACCPHGWRARILPSHALLPRRYHARIRPVDCSNPRYDLS